MFKKTLARLLRRWADSLDPNHPDLRPNYSDMKILRRRTVCRDSGKYFYPYHRRIEFCKDEQKRDLLNELGQYMVVERMTFPTHTLVETRISVLIE